MGSTGMMMMVSCGGMVLLGFLSCVGLLIFLVTTGKLDGGKPKGTGGTQPEGTTGRELDFYVGRPIHLVNVGRKGTCNAMMTVNACGGDATIRVAESMQNGMQRFQLERAGEKNTMWIRALGRTCDGKDEFLSVQPCGGNEYPDMWPVKGDIQKWTFEETGTPGRFRIAAAGRPGCARYLSVRPCATEAFVEYFRGVPDAGENIAGQTAVRTNDPNKVTLGNGGGDTETWELTLAAEV